MKEGPWWLFPLCSCSGIRWAVFLPDPKGVDASLLNHGSYSVRLLGGTLMSHLALELMKLKQIDNCRMLSKYVGVLFPRIFVEGTNWPNEQF